MTALKSIAAVPSTERKPAPCPEPEQIVGLVLGLIEEEEEKNSVSQHLRTCSRCRSEVYALSRAIERIPVRSCQA